MKKIVPFSNVLKFNTNVSEITAISLEHDITKKSDIISGIFYISGEYKIMDGEIDSEPFKFDLPFDIALSRSYDETTLNVDVDDFRYELIDNNKIKVNIDLCIDGEVLKEDRIDIFEEPINNLKEINDSKEPEIDLSVDNNNSNINTNSSNNIQEVPKEDYATYRVYRVVEGDTINTILEKYQITKEDLLNYNDNLDNINPGDKLIIPSK